MAAYNKLVGDLKEAQDQGFENRWNELRAFCFGMCRMFVALLLCNQASKDPRNKHIEVFSRWVSMQELYHNRFNNVLLILFRDKWIGNSHWTSMLPTQCEPEESPIAVAICDLVSDPYTYSEENFR